MSMNQEMWYDSYRYTLLKMVIFMRVIISKFFLLLGTLCLVAAAGWAGYNLYESYRAGKQSQETVEEMFEEYDLSKTEDPTEDFSDVPLYVRYPEMDMPVVEINGNRYIGYLEVPDKDLKLPVMETWSYDKLKISPCRYEGSIYLHNMVIAGHNYISHFWPIKSLKEGAEIYFTDMDKNVFLYKVAWTDLISPEHAEQMTEKAEGEEWDLTLFTCTAGNTLRHAVRCTLEEEHPAGKEE